MSIKSNEMILWIVLIGTILVVVPVVMRIPRRNLKSGDVPAEKLRESAAATNRVTLTILDASACMKK